MDYQVAIPSYRRADVLKKGTLSTLASLGVAPERIHVFVADEKDMQDYSFVREMGVSLVKGVPGLIHQRRFYNQFFTMGTPLLNVDDDLYKLKTLTDDGKKLREFTSDLNKVVDYAFKVCENHGARLWGISAVDNAFYMSDSTSIGLRYICGIFHGSYAGDTSISGNSRKLVSSGEDFETTLRSFKSNGAVVRLDWICPKTVYFAPGGMQEELGGNKEARQKEHSKELLDIAKRYAGLCKTYTKAGGVVNLRLTTMKSSKVKAPRLT